MEVSFHDRPVFTLLLAQGGEFAFVVFQAAAGALIFSAETASLLMGAVAVSMLVSPLLLVAIDKLLLPRYARRHKVVLEEIAEQQEAPVLIAGFGRYGQIVDLVRDHFPRLQIVARARDVTHWNQLRERQVMLVQREMFESSLRSARSVLELLGNSASAAEDTANRFRAHNLELFEQLHPHFKDRAKLIAVAKQGREQLEAQMAQERLERARRASSSPDDEGSRENCFGTLTRYFRCNYLTQAKRGGPPDCW